MTWLWRAAVFLLAFALCSASLRAQPAVRAEAKTDRAEVSYATHADVALTVEGPMPLLVELPKELLTAEAGAVWRAQPVGPAARETRPDGREAWRQVVRVRAYPPLAGDPAGRRVLSFNPVQVNGRPVAWNPVEIMVTRSVDNPSTPPRRPVGVEDPPPPPSSPPREPFPVWAAVALGLACVAVLVAAALRARTPPPVPPAEWALARLAKLEGAPPGAETVERVAAVLRGFVERRFAVPATKLTTAELAAAAREQGWPVEQADAIRALLDECDRAKFAGDVPDDDGCRRLVRLAVDWVNDVGRPAGPG